MNSVQEANRQYDAGLCPAMLVDEKFQRVYFKDVVDAIFSTDDRATAIAIIDGFDKFWQAIPGTRGATGKKTINASTMYSKFFEEVEEDTVQLEDEPEWGDEEELKLNQLELQVKE